MKRELTEQDRKDIEECFIRFNREEIKFDIETLHALL